MCCLNFTGILSVQLLLLMRYSIQFLPMTLQEEAVQWNIIIMGAANRQLWDQGNEIQLWDQGNEIQLWDQENGGQVIATATYSLGEQTTQIVQHHEVQCLAWISVTSGYQAKTYQVTKSTPFTRLYYEKKKQPTPALLRSHFSTLTHSPCLPTSSYFHLLTPIHPPYAPKLSPISLLPTPPHSPPLPPPHTLTFSSTLILVLSCSPEVF